MSAVTVSILAATACSGALSWAAAAEYATDGTPTPLEEEIRWHVNRGRFDPARENQERATAYTDVPAYAPPLAPHQSITLAARHHSEDMARNNAFQHATVPGSGYYDPVTQPTPWDRMEAEGYSWNRAGENIAAGYSSAKAAYVGWWKSEGHRRNMYDTRLREIGNGYFYLSGSEWGRYYTMDLGTSGSTHFFTDTLFHDANDDGAYTQGEGVAGVRVDLIIDGTAHSYFDVSTAAGSFAVPIQSIPDGATVEVRLRNTTAASVALDLPQDYSTYTPLTLASGQDQGIGTFVQPTSAQNLGLRDLDPAPAEVEPPELELVTAGSYFQLRWMSQTGIEYLPQWTADLLTWNDLSQSYQAGTGAEMTHLDAGSPAARRFYRLQVRPR